MDLNPLIPNATTSHDVTHILSECFEDAVKTYNKCDNVAVDNYVDKDYGLFKDYSKNKSMILNVAENDHYNLNSVELDMMVKHGENLVSEDDLEKNALKKDIMLLKRDGYFRSYNLSCKCNNLIDKRDILPTRIEQSLDFVYNKDFHSCETNHCSKSVKEKFLKSSRKEVSLQIGDKNCKMKIPEHKTHKLGEKEVILKIEPKEVIFNDFEINEVYKKKFRVQNCSTQKRPFFFKYPKDSPFSLKVLSDHHYLAPGMSVDFILYFCPKINHNSSLIIEISTSGGSTTSFKALTFRKPPHLRVYILRSIQHLFWNSKCPGNSEFWDKRCTALNDTIDCGHCFIGNTNSLSLIIENIGSPGRFFCLNEEEWVSGNINHINTPLQFSKDCFKIFPRYLSIERDEVAELFITFSPELPGLHIEKLYLISDNNTVKLVEIFGDGLFFSKSCVKVNFKPAQFEKCPMIGLDESGTEDEFFPQHIFFMGQLTRNSSCNYIVFTVNNRCALYLTYYWTLRTDTDGKTAKPLNQDLVRIGNTENSNIPPYTTFDFDIEINPMVEKQGYYSILVGLYIDRIPVKSLEEDEEFITLNQREIEGIEVVDVQIFEINLVCEIIEVEEVEDTDTLNKCKCNSIEENGEKIIFSDVILDLRVLPVGLDLQRSFEIHKKVDENVYWRIIEIIYDVDLRPSMFLSRIPSTDKSSGILTEDECTLKYLVTTKEPKRWVSMLLLFSGEKIEEMVLSSVCMVTYEVIDWNIKIFSKVSKFPIVCSLKLHYIGKKYKWTFYIQNFTPLLGCFWLFPPVGNEVDMLELEYRPKFGVIRPGQKIEITVYVIPKEIGIIEEIYIPCFFDKYNPPIMIRIMCAADDVNVYFYIPSQADGFQKILWPAKFLNEVDFQNLETTNRLLSEEEFETNTRICMDNEKLTISDGPLSSTEESKCESNLTESYQPVNSHSSLTKNSFSSHIISLVDYMREQYESDFNEHDYTIEVRDVFLREPKKFSFYIENVSPIRANFTIEINNFKPFMDREMTLNNALAVIRPSNTFKFWDDACIKNGIVVIPDTHNGSLKYGETILINVWIYATTWGIYTEEIIVNINNISPFFFKVFIEVNGAPVEFPMARNTIRSFPILRFGYISYKADIVSERLYFKNITCVPLSIQWFIFDVSKKSEDIPPFDILIDMVDRDFRSSEGDIRILLTNRWHGQRDIQFIEVHPRCIKLSPDEVNYIEIKIDPRYFPVDFKETNISCSLIGYIFLKNEDKKQQPFIFRTSGAELKPLRVEILATISMPLLKLDVHRKNPKIHFHAIEALENINQRQFTQLIFKNTNHTKVFVSFHIELPFSINSIVSRGHEYIPDINNAIINPGDVVEVNLSCILNEEKIISMANWIYHIENPQEENISIEHNIVQIHSHLNIHQRGVLEQSVPVFCEIHYPKLSIYPLFLTFHHVKIGMTKKLYLHLFNSTNIDIVFTVRKMYDVEEFRVVPEEATIQKAVGIKDSSIDLCVYFKPTKQSHFQESIVIETKIPQCSLEVPMNGSGIQNEKFEVDNMFFQP